MIMHNDVMEWLDLPTFENDGEWWAIYQSSFPKKERDTLSQLVFALTQGLANIGRFRLDNKTVAMAVRYDMQQLPFHYLNYFAIHQDYRNQQLGTRLFQALKKEAEAAYQQDSTHLGLFWEVEEVSGADLIVKQKRIDFYLRHEGKILPHLFIQPPLDGVNCVNERLMFYSLQPANKIAALEKDIASTIYYEKYVTVNNIPKTILDRLLAVCYSTVSS